MEDNEYSPTPNLADAEHSEGNSSVLNEIDIDGQKVSLEEARKGYLRQSDYTKKSTELAEAKRVYDELSGYASKNQDKWQKIVAFMQGASDLGTSQNGTSKQPDFSDMTKKEFDALRSEIKQRDEILGKIVLERDMERINSTEKYGGFFKDDANKKMLLKLARGMAGDSGFESLQAVADEFFDFSNSLRAADRVKAKGSAAMVRPTITPSKGSKEKVSGKMSDADRRSAMIDFVKQRMDD